MSIAQPKKKSTKTSTEIHATQGEPVVAGIELSVSVFANILNWYTLFISVDKSMTYLKDYLRHHKVPHTPQSLASQTKTFGNVARIVMRGGELPPDGKVWFDQKLARLSLSIRQNDRDSLQEVDPSDEPPQKAIVSIQDRILEATRPIIGKLEGLVDEFILSNCAKGQRPGDMMLSLKGPHAKLVIDHFKTQRDFFQRALVDETVREHYSNFTKTQIKRMIEYYDDIIGDALHVIGEGLKNRSPRKKKAQSPIKLVKRLKFLQSDEATKLTSIDPTTIIGAMSLWVYVPKTRKLGCYLADDRGGLTIKGSTILNYTKVTSIQKTLRKPEVVLPRLLEGGKTILKNLLETINAQSRPLNGRINKQTIIVRVA